MTKIKEVIKAFEIIAPRHFAESYDNPGLICGDAEKEVQGVITCLDCTEAVVSEALEKQCNLIVAHHPVIFKGLNSITGKNYVERTIIAALKNDIAIYAIHTNIDSILEGGVSHRLGQELGLENMKVLSPKKEQMHLELRVLEMRVDDAQRVSAQLTRSSFDQIVDVETDEGPRKWMRWTGRSDHANRLHQALLEEGMIAEQIPSQTASIDVGLGVTGELHVPLPEMEFLSMLKSKIGGSVVRHTPLLGKSVHQVAICGGAGSSLLPKAKATGADAFITGDFKYHQFFDADGDLIIADVGHFESEQWTIPLLKDWISEKFSTFAVHCTTVVTNPVNYF
ncbi:MAG: Nif3-like dinuclear metal center hexameric protein [Bacteroidetes bacterium]|jgi:dinuclear metal center YbgI/SA1388 family protein|nr:Nif3-like dinuclear metal center hexameric protein [Bacteroidota bacterium]